jgi:four helix bundle suffix protein
MSDLIFAHGGYKKLKSFQIARLVYDLTVIFTDHYIDSKSRTKDQMIQAARSGVQNIAEGSLASGTSKKTELKLTNVARASLEELKLDYQDYLRQHGESLWLKDDLLYIEFIKRRISCKKEFREFIAWAENHISVPIRTIPYKSVLVANAVLLIIDTASYFLKRQIEKKAAIFLEDCGFSERMHNMRTQKRKKDQ